METNIVGFKFEVVKNGIIGVIDGKSRNGIYDVTFFKDGNFYLSARVYEETIINNLIYGVYKEI